MKRLKKLKEYNKSAIISNNSLNNSEPKLNGIECPECSSELYDSKPMVILTSMPAKKNVHCGKCGYKGYRIA